MLCLFDIIRLTNAITLCKGMELSCFSDFEVSLMEQAAPMLIKDIDMGKCYVVQKKKKNKKNKNYFKRCSDSENTGNLCVSRTPPPPPPPTTTTTTKMLPPLETKIKYFGNEKKIDKYPKSKSHFKYKKKSEDVFTNYLKEIKIDDECYSLEMTCDSRKVTTKGDDDDCESNDNDNNDNNNSNFNISSSKISCGCGNVGGHACSNVCKGIRRSKNKYYSQEDLCFDEDQSSVCYDEDEETPVKNRNTMETNEKNVEKCCNDNNGDNKQGRQREKHMTRKNVLINYWPPQK